MKTPREYRDQNFAKRDICPHRRAAPPTAREWLFVGALLLIGFSLSVISA